MSDPQGMPRHGMCTKRPDVRAVSAGEGGMRGWSEATGALHLDEVAFHEQPLTGGKAAEPGNMR